MQENFSEQFEKFLPIVYKASQLYRLHLWTMDDYKQEGMIIYYELLQKNYPEQSLPVYFKVQYRQHLINLIRKQKAMKRGYDAGNYVELETVHNQIADQSFSIESELLLSDTMESFIQQLRKNEQQILMKLINGEEVSRVQKFRLKQKLLGFLKEDSFN